jgi:hypothetical protein
LFLAHFILFEFVKHDVRFLHKWNLWFPNIRWDHSTAGGNCQFLGIRDSQRHPKNASLFLMANLFPYFSWKTIYKSPFFGPWCWVQRWKLPQRNHTYWSCSPNNPVFGGFVPIIWWFSHHFLYIFYIGLSIFFDHFGDFLHIYCYYCYYYCCYLYI